MTDLELTVRTIEDMLPDMSTAQLQKWKGILQSALIKIDKELTAVSLHTCVICFHEEWGYRDDLPISWYKKGNAEICFQHEYDKAEELLRGAGWTDDAEEPVEIEPVGVENLRVAMDHLPEPPPEEEQTLKELMDLV